MHFLGMPTFMKTVFELMSSFAKDKMKKRFVLSAKGDFAKLIEEVGTDILPAEYGGTNGIMQDHIGKAGLSWMNIYILLPMIFLTFR